MQVNLFLSADITTNWEGIMSLALSNAANVQRIKQIEHRDTASLLVAVTSDGDLFNQLIDQLQEERAGIIIKESAKQLTFYDLRNKETNHLAANTALNDIVLELQESINL